MATLTTLAFVLLGLWVLSFFVFHIAGFLIHLLLIVAIVMILVRIIKGENPFK
ncbi:MAG TPA: lmo0937 family membrane protein [Candidatus Yonathbacteria bacterium]|nr:lmo0937 family membrane protein [Candidatus Yonathbacteria bacterium]